MSDNAAPNPDYDRWCFTSKEADGLPTLTHLLHRVCQNDEKRFVIALDILQQAFEAGGAASLVKAIKRGKK